MAYILSGFADEAHKELSEQIRIFKKLGISFIEMRGVDGKNVSDLTPSEAKEIKKKLDDNGMFVSAVGSPCGKMQINDDFSAHLDKFKRTVELANILGTQKMRMFSFFIPQDEPASNFKSKVMEYLNAFLENAENVTLYHENEKDIYGDTAERCREIYYTFYGKIKLIFDPSNFIQCGEDTLRAYDLLDNGVDYFHIKDARKDGTVVLPGRGEGHVAKILEMAYSDDKKMFLSIEPHLRIFSGFTDLQAKQDLKNEIAFNSGEEAFEAAANALKEILIKMELKECTNCEGSFKKWKK